MLRGCKPHVQTPVQSIEFKVAFCDIGGVQYRIERMRMLMSRSVIAVTFAAFFVAAATAQQNIPTGGPIPDRRGLNST